MPSFYGYDAHGNITFLTDASGNPTDAYDYDAWGNVVGRIGSTPNTRLYTGEEVDPDFGLTNLRARQYEPTTGRFLTLDPVDAAKPGPTSGETADTSGSPTTSESADFIEDPYVRVLIELSGRRPSVSRRLLHPSAAHRFMYADADPVDLSDPTGQDTFFEYVEQLYPKIKTLRLAAMRLGDATCAALMIEVVILDCWPDPSPQCVNAARRAFFACRRLPKF